MKLSSLIHYHRFVLVALAVFIVGAGLAMLGLIQKVPLEVGILGVVLLSSGLFYFSLNLASLHVYKDYYKESYEIEHETIEEEIRKSMLYHRYQEAVLNRYESACRDLGISQEQQDWLLNLLMEEKKKVDKELSAQGGGRI